MVIGPGREAGNNGPMTTGIAGSVANVRDERHSNAFGFLRLFFASLVIVSHTPELLDGDFRREPLVVLFGTISFGYLAVDGFFLISGYLIVGSFIKNPDIVAYFRNRIARIYPGFVVASLVSVLIVAPLAGATVQAMADIAARSALKIFVLDDPWVPGAFSANPVTTLNGPMWTIAYEFRCYLLVVFLGLAGAFRYPALIAVLAIACLFAAEALPQAVTDGFDELFSHSTSLFGRLEETLRLTGMFLAGAWFFLKRGAIPFTLTGAVGAGAALVACLFVERLAEPGLALFGGYLIFAVAVWGGRGVLARINNGNDISYGVYLYAWPASQLMVHYWPGIGVWELGIATFAAAGLCGWLSWHLVEKPAMQRLRDLIPGARTSPHRRGLPASAHP